MIKEVHIAKEGFEDIFEILNNKIEKIEEDKKAEIERIVVEVTAKYDIRLEEYRNTLNSVSKIEQIEVEDEPIAEEVQEQEVVGE